MIRLLIAIPLLLGFVQDEAAIQDLIKRLDDGDLEAREKAVRDLIQCGAKALAPLRKAAASESAEVRARVEQAIRLIELDIKSREVCPPYPAFTLKKSGTVGEVLDELARLSGARIEASEEQRQGKASADATSLFQALDQVCAGRENLTYSFGDDGKIKFLSERHSPTPTGYFEAFKVFLTEINALRRSDYKETTVTARISLHAAWETRLKPVKRVRFESMAAKDDAGRDVELVSASAMDMVALGGGGGVWVGGFGEENDSAGPQMFSLKGLSPEAKSLAFLKGTAKVSFPLSRVDVAFEDPQSKANQTVGDLTIRLKGVSTKMNRISVTFGKTKGDVAGLRDEITARLDGESVRAIDEDGKEHVGEMSPAQRDAGAAVFLTDGQPSKTAQFHATFPTLEGKEFKRFMFKISESMFEKSVPFEIKDIKLP